MERLDGKIAAELKAELRALADGADGRSQVNLDDPANAYTIWMKNGDQGYFCMGSGSDPAVADSLAGKYLRFDPVILQVSNDGDKPKDLVVIVRCTLG